MAAVSYRLTFASCNPLLNFTPKSRLADPAEVPTVRFVPFSDAEGDMMFVSATLSLSAILRSSNSQAQRQIKRARGIKKPRVNLISSKCSF